MSYVESLGEETHEWLLAMFVDNELQLLAVDTVARGDISSCPVPFASILCRGHQLGAAGFILVHNHPSGDPTPSDSDRRITIRLHHASKALDMPLLAHLIVANGKLLDVTW